VNKIQLTDFSGGFKFAFAAEDFGPNEWVELKGFILVQSYLLRSQPPLQQIGTEEHFIEIRPLIAADGTQFLIGIREPGHIDSREVWYTTAPTSGSSAFATKTFTWTRITSSNGTATLTLDRYQHFLTDIEFQEPSIAGGRTIPALLINQNNFINAGFNSYPIIIWADSLTSIGAWRTTSASPNVFPGYTPAAPSNVTATHAAGTITVSWTPPPDYRPIGMSANKYTRLGYNIYLSNGDLKVAAVAANATTATFAGTATDIDVVVRAYNGYGETPFDAGGGIEAPGTGITPHAEVGAYWNGQLILADIQYWKDPTDIVKRIPPDTGTPRYQRLRNGIWFSNPGNPTQFDPLAQFTVGQPDSQITAMTVVPQGLLVFTKSISNDSGIFLLRGTSAGVVLDNELALNFSVELVRGGVGTRGFTTAAGGHGHVTAWPATGTVVFLDETSQVWQTNTQGVTSLDTNIAAVQTAAANPLDNVAAWDKYLFFAPTGRLFVLRELGESGAWTEFVLPSTTSNSPGPYSMAELGNSVYFIWDNGTNKNVWRYNMQPTGSALFEFGKIDNVLVDLSMTTRPVRSGDDQHQKTFWHRVGLRFRGTSTFAISSMSSAPYIIPQTGAPVAPGQLQIVNNPAISYGFPANYRGEKTYPMHGPSNEAQVRFVLRGSAEVEGITLYAHGKKPNRP
jgi:hypothetical protein